MQKQLAEEIRVVEMRERLELAKSLREELELVQEEQQHLAGRTTALERKTGRLTSEIVRDACDARTTRGHTSIGAPVLLLPRAHTHAPL